MCFVFHFFTLGLFTLGRKPNTILLCLSNQIRYPIFLMSPTEHNGVINDHTSISFREVVETHKRALYFLSLDLTLELKLKTESVDLRKSQIRLVGFHSKTAQSLSFVEALMFGKEDNELKKATVYAASSFGSMNLFSFCSNF
jgi:hypothetical protein